MKDFIRLNFLKVFFAAIFFIGCYPSFCQSKNKPVQLSKEEVQKKVLQISTETIRVFGDLNSDLGQTDFAELVSELESLYKQFPDHKFVRYIARKLCLARKCDEEAIEIIKNAIEKLEDVFDQDLESSIDPVAKAVVLFCRKLKRIFCYFSLEDFICNEGGSFTWFAKKHIWEAGIVTTVICSFLAGYYLGKGNREQTPGFFGSLGSSGSDYRSQSSLILAEKGCISIFANPARKTMAFTQVKVPGQSGATCRECSLAAAEKASQVPMKEPLTADKMTGTTTVVANYLRLAGALLKKTDFLMDLEKRQKQQILSEIENMTEIEDPTEQLRSALDGKIDSQERKFIQFLNQNSAFFREQYGEGFLGLDHKSCMEQCVNLLVERRLKIFKEQMKRIADGSFSRHTDDVFIYDQFFMSNLDELIKASVKNKKEQKDLKDYIEWLKAKDGNLRPIKLCEDGIDTRVLALIRKDTDGGSIDNESFVVPIKSEKNGNYGITKEMLAAFRNGQVPICLSFRPNAHFDHFVCAIFRNEGTADNPVFKIYYMDSLNHAPSSETKDSLFALGRFLTEDNPSLEPGADISKLQEIKAVLAKDENNIEGKNDLLIASIDSLISSNKKT